MNRAELIEELSARFEGNRRAAGHALDSVLDTITRTVAKGEKVALTGFGVFERAQRAARTARNPATGEPVRVRATAVPRFKASQALKEVVSGARKLPRLVINPPPTVRPAEAPAKKAAAPGRPAAKKAAPSRAAGKKTTTRKAAKKAPARKKAAAKKAPARKGAKAPAGKAAAAKKAPARKKAAAKKAPARKKAAAKKSTTKRTTSRKATPRRAAAKTTKRTARKTTSR